MEIKNLHVETRDGKKILNGINLKLEKGKIYALMGPNGSGKSTLANAITGSPGFKVTAGEVLFEGENVLNLSADERARKGIFLSFQYPKEIPGVTLSGFLRAAYNSVNENSKLSLLEFRGYLKEKSDELKIGDEFLNRYLNDNFSGGEKKKGEILQMKVLNPRLAVLDETDSGLDVDSLKVVADGIRKFMSEDKIILVITHYKRILEHLKPDRILVMKGGEIVKEGDYEITDKLEKEGYENL